ncbi:hypothetical protein [Cellulomonas sp. ATA003]|uniref:hypothetical protein n=1 Tax=Cellulomonas sp. ATA003 TaxID=3073064 RepID=UPI0028734ABA|nr:hypothetical protein [Cellulomonas sp. ATA003]WNB84285.1 hypothetical protein REH70_10285 [Cellulomonas sp. ATA003]
MVETEPADTGGPAATFQPTAARLLVLDATTGTVLREEPTVPTTAVAALGADLVLSHLDDDGRLVVRRTDAGAEQERWSFTSPDALTPSTSGRWASVAVEDDLVVAGGDSGWVLSVDGRELHRWQPSPTGAGWLDLLPGGLVVEPGSPVTSGRASSTRGRRRRSPSTDARCPSR